MNIVGILLGVYVSLIVSKNVFRSCRLLCFANSVVTLLSIRLHKRLFGTYAECKLVLSSTNGAYFLIVVLSVFVAISIAMISGNNRREALLDLEKIHLVRENRVLN